MWSKFHFHGNDIELLMKFYTINHSHYHHLITLTKRADNVMDSIFVLNALISEPMTTEHVSLKCHLKWGYQLCWTILPLFFQTTSILELLAESTSGCAVSALLIQVIQILSRACLVITKHLVFRWIFVSVSLLKAVLRVTFLFSVLWL